MGLQPSSVDRVNGCRVLTSLQEPGIKCACGANCLEAESIEAPSHIFKLPRHVRMRRPSSTGATALMFPPRMTRFHVQEVIAVWKHEVGGFPVYSRSIQRGQTDRPAKAPKQRCRIISEMLFTESLLIIRYFSKHKFPPEKHNISGVDSMPEASCAVSDMESPTGKII
jgi:hypothetical protein